MKQKNKIYDSAFKERLVLMSYGKKSTVKLEKEFDLQRGLLTTWRQKHERLGNKNFSADHFSKLRVQNEKIQELEKQIKRMDEKFQILKAAGAYLNKETNLLHAFVLNNEKSYSITLMCKVLNINRSFYHKWKKNQFSKTQILKRLRQQKIIEAFYAAEQRYGANKITAVLQNGGFQISLTTVKKYMKEIGLKCNSKNSRSKNRKPSQVFLQKDAIK